LTQKPIYPGCFPEVYGRFDQFILNVNTTPVMSLLSSDTNSIAFPSDAKLLPYSASPGND